MMNKSELHVAVPQQELVGLTISDQDHSVDAMNTGFLWYKPTVTLNTEHQTGGHTWTISGHDYQILTTTVPPGEEVITEVGSFMFMHPSMMTDVELTLCSKGGCREGWSRICGGESCVKVILRNGSGEEGYAGITPNFPAKIIPLKFGTNTKSVATLIAHGGAVMTQMGDVDVGCDLDCSFATCCCAGIGCCRQKISASDDSVAFLAAGGTLIYKVLRDGETITVDSGSVVAFEDSVNLGITPNGRFCTCLCGGEGCFSTTLTGPGKVWLQSMSFKKFQAAVQTTVYEEMDRGKGGGDGSGGSSG